MKVGDLVRHINTELECGEVGIIVDIIQKKVWRTHLLGKKIDWNKVQPEPHGVVMYSELINFGELIAIPTLELVVVESEE